VPVGFCRSISIDCADAFAGKSANGLDEPERRLLAKNVNDDARSLDERVAL
jgi:hypothetical protein